MSSEPDHAHPERALVLAYAPLKARAALAALLALDDTLARVVASTTEPALGQMRLTWWHDALERLDTAPPPAEPVLSAMAREVLPHGVTGGEGARMIDAWDVLIEEETLDEAAMQRFAERGGILFKLAARVLGAEATQTLMSAGQGWALADLSLRLGSAEEREMARGLATPLLEEGLTSRWPAASRPLGALAHLARMELQVPGSAGSPRRVARALWHRLTGK